MESQRILQSTDSTSPSSLLIVQEQPVRAPKRSAWARQLTWRPAPETTGPRGWGSSGLKF